MPVYKLTDVFLKMRSCVWILKLLSTNIIITPHVYLGIPCLFRSLFSVFPTQDYNTSQKLFFKKKKKEKKEIHRRKLLHTSSRHHDLCLSVAGCILQPSSSWWKTYTKWFPSKCSRFLKYAVLK